MVKKSGTYNINDKTQVHMTSVYTRSSSVKRSLSLVINGLFISSILLGALTFGGGNIASANAGTITTPVATSQQVDANYQDEQALIANLNLAVKVIKENGWSIKALSAVMDKLTAIEAKLTSTDGFINVESLKLVILETEKVVIAQGSDGLSTLRGSNNTIMETVGRIKGNLGMVNKSDYASQ